MNSNKSRKQAPSILDIVKVNEKGQVVIPASARSIVDIEAGDKLLVMIHPSQAGIVLMKPDGLEQYANQVLEQLIVAKKTYKQRKKANE